MLAAPYIVNNEKLLTNNVVNTIDIEKTGDNVFYKITYTPVSEKQSNWIDCLLRKEKNIFTINYGKNIEAKFFIPKTIMFTVNIIKMNDFELITKNIILDNISFYKENAFCVFLALNKKPGLQRYNSGYFLLVDFHYLIFVISTF